VSLNLGLRIYGHYQDVKKNPFQHSKFVRIFVNCIKVLNGRIS